MQQGGGGGGGSGGGHGGNQSQYGEKTSAAASHMTQQQQQQQPVEPASPISSRPPATSITSNFDELMRLSGGGEEDEGDRAGGVASGNRWPRQETLGLLKIRSDMDAAFREATVKGPLWEDVSRFCFAFPSYIINIIFFFKKKLKCIINYSGGSPSPNSSS